MYRIVGHTTHRVMKAVHEELASTGRRYAAHLPRDLVIHVGLLADLPDREALIRSGQINLHNTDPLRDAVECLRTQEGIYLLGSTPRGVLQAVYAFEEQLAFEGVLPMPWHMAGTFRIGQRHFHPRFSGWPGERADVRYLSRLGASHCLVSHDWSGSLRSLQGYVTSPVFPNAMPADEVARNRAGLEALIGHCEDFGLGISLWLTELPCQGGPWVPEPIRQAWLARYPDDVLRDSGTYQGKVLCFSHPQVQAFYRDLLARFFCLFPQVETLFLFGMDSGGEGCDPGRCPRCQGLSKFAQRDRLVRFLIEEGERVRPGLRVLTTGWHWESEPSEFLDRQASLPAASGLYMAAQSDGWQCERQGHALLRQARAICREKNQLFIGYDNLHQGDDATHLWGVDIQDFPLGVGAKLARWHDLGVDGVFDHWGTYSERIATNSIACREFFLNPLADPAAIGRQLAIRQYGEHAGRYAYSAWQALEQAHRILSHATSWAPRQWPAWYQGKGVAPLPAAFRVAEDPDTRPLVAKEALGFTYNAGDPVDCMEKVAEAWRLALPPMLEAEAQLDQAIAAADEVPVGYAFWWNGAAKVPSRREHLERHRLYVAFMLRLGREIGLHFGLHARYVRCGGNDHAYLDGIEDALREDQQACREIVAFIDAIEPRLCEGAEGTRLASWRTQYQAKIDEIESWIAAHPQGNGSS